MKRNQPALADDLTARLGEIRERGLYRELRRVDSAQGTRVEIDGCPLINFASNDYLGLAGHRRLKDAAIMATERYGAGSGASRLICGSQAPWHELEEALAMFKGTEAALAFASGFAAATGTIGALLGKEDVIILDKLVHACIVDAARQCGAQLRVFDHNDVTDLEKILHWAAGNTAARILVVTESVFSMDGDWGRLEEIAALKEHFGFWLMVDEAHATGLYGKGGRGLAAELGLSERVDIHMGTLGKAVGASGGFICGPQALKEFLVNRARPFIFSTAPPPAAAAAAKAGLELIQMAEGEARRQALWQQVDTLKAGLAKQGWPLATQRSAILPLLLGTEARAVSAAAALQETGIFAPAIRYPTVARGAARLRVTLSADHSTPDVQCLLAALEHIQHEASQA